MTIKLPYRKPVFTMYGQAGMMTRTIESMTTSTSKSNLGKNTGENWLVEVRNTIIMPDLN